MNQKINNLPTVPGIPADTPAVVVFLVTVVPPPKDVVVVVVVVGI